VALRFPPGRAGGGRPWASATTEGLGPSWCWRSWLSSSSWCWGRPRSWVLSSREVPRSPRQTWRRWLLRRRSSGAQPTPAWERARWRCATVLRSKPACAPLTGRARCPRPLQPGRALQPEPQHALGPLRWQTVGDQDEAPSLARSAPRPCRRASISVSRARGSPPVRPLDQREAYRLSGARALPGTRMWSLEGRRRRDHQTARPPDGKTSRREDQESDRGVPARRRRPAARRARP
jgi:hypothetical protein